MITTSSKIELVSNQPWEYLYVNPAESRLGQGPRVLGLFVYIEEWQLWDL